MSRRTCEHCGTALLTPTQRRFCSRRCAGYKPARARTVRCQQCWDVLPRASASAIAAYAQGITAQTCRAEDVPVQDREAVQTELVRRYARARGWGAV